MRAPRASKWADPALLALARHEGQSIERRSSAYRALLEAMPLRGSTALESVALAREAVMFCVDADAAGPAREFVRLAIDRAAGSAEALTIALGLECRVCYAIGHSASAGDAAALVLADPGARGEAAFYAHSVGAQLEISVSRDRSVAHVEAAEQIALEMERPDLLVLARAHRAHVLGWWLELETALSVADEVIERVVDQPPAIRDVVMFRAAGVYRRADRLDQALAAVVASEDAAVEAGLRRSALSSAIQRAVCLRLLGRVDEAEETYVRLQGIAQDLGDHVALAHIWYGRGLVERQRGELESAAKWMQLALETYAARRLHHYVTDTKYYVGVISLEDGRPLEALSMFAAVLPYYQNERSGKDADLVFESIGCAHAALDQHGLANEFHAKAAALRAADPHVSGATSRRDQPFAWMGGR